MDWTGWLGSLDDRLYGHRDLMDWNTNFGQSSECKSYAKAMRQDQHAFLGYGGSDTIIQTVGESSCNYSPQLPPGVLRADNTTCCGNCSLKIPEVKLYYFPDQTITSCRSNQTFDINSVSPSDDSNKEDHSLAASRNTAIVSGYTL